MLDGIPRISWGVVPLSSAAPAGGTSRTAGRGRCSCDGFGSPSIEERVGASRAAAQVCHTSQGQDERARTRLPRLLRGLDLAWPWEGNPHRESGTRWRAAADVGQAAGPGRTSASSRKGTMREPFGRLRWSKEGCSMPQVAPFFGSCAVCVVSGSSSA
jgi:hypothetical protein